MHSKGVTAQGLKDNEQGYGGTRPRDEGNQESVKMKMGIVFETKIKTSVLVSIPSLPWFFGHEDRNDE